MLCWIEAIVVFVLGVCGVGCGIAGVVAGFIYGVEWLYTNGGNYVRAFWNIIGLLFLCCYASLLLFIFAVWIDGIHSYLCP